MTDTHSSVGARAPTALDRRAGRFYWTITALGSMAFAGNGLILSAISFALPGIRREWSLDPVELGVVAASVAAGQMCGSLVVGSLADHWGRRRVFAGTITLMALAIGLAALAFSPLVLSLLLFVAGLGFSGVGPVASSLLSEFVPPRIRGQAFAWTQVFWTTGWCLAAAGGALLAATLGWRWILGLGLFPIVLGLVSLKLTPESPRFLLAHGRRGEAEAVVREIETRYGVRLPLPEQQRAAARPNPFRSLAELVGPVYRRRTITIWVSWFIMNAAFSGPVTWLPAILATAGGDDAFAARLSLIVGLCMLPASMVAVLLIDRLGRRPLMLLSLVLATVGTLVLAFAGNDLTIAIGGGALAAGLLGAWPIVLGYTAELYPTRVRATAAGWAGVVTRSGGVIAPLLLGGLLGASAGNFTLAVGIFAALLAIATLLIAVQGEETRGRTLEELSG